MANVVGLAELRLALMDAARRAAERRGEPMDWRRFIDDAVALVAPDPPVNPAEPDGAEVEDRLVEWQSVVFEQETARESATG